MRASCVVTQRSSSARLDVSISICPFRAPTRTRPRIHGRSDNPSPPLNLQPQAPRSRPLLALMHAHGSTPAPEHARVAIEHRTPSTPPYAIRRTCQCQCQCQPSSRAPCRPQCYAIQVPTSNSPPSMLPARRTCLSACGDGVPALPTYTYLALCCSVYHWSLAWRLPVWRHPAQTHSAE